MRVISSHVLDSVRGCDAAGIRVSCTRLLPSGDGELVTDIYADDAGRVAISVDTAHDLPETRYQLIFFTGEYFAKCLDEKQSAMLSPIIESVLHLDLSLTSGRCHVPMMIAPHSHSVWWSREDQ